jgi:hypothetical protein
MVLTVHVSGGRVTKEVMQFRTARSFTEMRIIYSRFGSAPTVQIPSRIQPLPKLPEPRPTR